MLFELPHSGVIHDSIKLRLNFLHLYIVKELDSVHAVQDPLLITLVLVNDVVDFVVLVIKYSISISAFGISGNRCNLGSILQWPRASSIQGLSI